MQRRIARDPSTTFLTGANPASTAHRRTSQRLPRVIAALVHMVLGALLLVAGPAGAQPSQEDPPSDPNATSDGYVAVIEVSGLLDRVLVDFVETQLEAAEEADATALVLQLNSGSAVVADDRLEALVERIEVEDVPEAAWVGPCTTEEGGAGKGGGGTCRSRGKPLT